MGATAVELDSTEVLLAAYAIDRDPVLRDQIIERHGALVRSIANRFVRPGVSVEDLVQTAWLALIGAVDRYDPTHKTKFSNYALTCMVGEIKRYFRDRTWVMKVPRPLRELTISLNVVQEKLSQKLQRSPTVAELAKAVGVSDETVLHAMELAHAYQPFGLDEQRGTENGDDSWALAETVGSPDRAIDAVVERAPLEAALQNLDPRKRWIIRLRFLEEQSQQQVAKALGVSQMHISRLERAALSELRSALTGHRAK